MTFLPAWVNLGAWLCFLSTKAVAGKGTAMAGQPCTHLFFVGMAFRWRKKKKWDICRYQMVEIEAEGGTAVLAGW